MFGNKLTLRSVWIDQRLRQKGRICQGKEEMLSVDEKGENVRKNRQIPGREKGNCFSCVVREVRPSLLSRVLTLEHSNSSVTVSLTKQMELYLFTSLSSSLMSFHPPIHSVTVNNTKLWESMRLNDGNENEKRRKHKKKEAIEKLILIVLIIVVEVSLHFMASFVVSPLVNTKNKRRPKHTVSFAHTNHISPFVTPHEWRASTLFFLKSLVLYYDYCFTPLVKKNSWWGADDVKGEKQMQQKQQDILLLLLHLALAKTHVHDLFGENRERGRATKIPFKTDCQNNNPCQASFPKWRERLKAEN